MIKWWNLTDQQRDELVALHVLKWEKINEQWFEQNENGKFEVPVTLFPFTTDEELAWKLLRSFDNWQVTKMFPLTYRVIISANKYSCLSKSLPEAICKAALKFNGVNLGGD